MTVIIKSYLYTGPKPVFDNLPQTVTLEENTVVGAAVFQVKASHEHNSGGLQNYNMADVVPLTFSLSHATFNINPNTGEWWKLEHTLFVF